MLRDWAYLAGHCSPISYNQTPFGVPQCTLCADSPFTVAPLALNYRYVDRLSLSTRYGLDAGSHSLTDYGSEVTLDLTWKFSDMIKWKTRLYGYTTYKRAELEWENTLSFQFNRYISTNIFIYPRFDDGTARDDHHGYWQFKEYASLGFSYSI